MQLLIVAQFECSDIYVLVVCCFLCVFFFLRGGVTIDYYVHGSCSVHMPFVLGLLCLEIQCYLESTKC